MEKEETNILGTEKIGKLIKKFSIPCIISLLSKFTLQYSRPNFYWLGSWLFRKWSNKCSVSH